ncbi:MAG: folylpolyglutamate synthase/dihydrofolate synthase family protein [Bacteroidota bacterium]
MSLQEAIDYLYSMLPMYQRVGKVAYKKDLTNTLALLQSIDNPHKKFKCVHIAGTNGKGTSAHGIAAILQSAGFKTGLYTSPHLKRFTERIKIDGEEITDEFVTRFVEENKHVFSTVHPSFFEVTVAMAFYYFADQGVDIAVIETGLGGRLDSTNVITPEVSLITNIGLDHTDLLGETLPEIAVEKAGIIKRGVPVVIGNYQEEVIHVFKDKAENEQAELTLAEAHFTVPKLPDLFPDYFKKNVPGMLAVIHELGKKGFYVGQDQIAIALANVGRLTGLKGRFQILQEDPLLIADVSHNQEGLRMLLNQVERINKGKLHLIFGTVKDKNIDHILSTLPKHAHYYWSQSSVPRSLEATQLKIQGSHHDLKGNVFNDVNEAMEQARAKAHERDLILITGSTFLISEIAVL